MKTPQRLSVTSVGGLLPQDILDRIAAGDRDIEGLRAEDYHLSGERTADAILRAWSRLRTAWTAFDAARNEQGEASGPLTGLTLEKWLLPLFAALDYGRLTAAEPVTMDGDTYRVSHEWQGVPIHLVGVGVELDRRQKGVRGAAAMSPHSLMQVLLNRDPNRLWGIVSNGLRLRVLRDSASLTRQAYLEFDLEAMFAGDLYADFALLWLVAHQSRFEARAGETCWLEKWLGSARSTGIRALDDLRRGVEGAIAALGQGFLSNSDNHRLRDALRGGALTPHGYYQQLLRLVYRLIFVMVAEARGLLLDPAAPAEAHKRYLRYYALERLRDLARRPTSGPRHGDLYEEVKLVMGLLAGRGDAQALGLSVLNGFLFSETTTPHLDDSRLANGALLEAMRTLCYTTEKDGRVRPVDFRALGAEELGSVYESLLELVPEVDSNGAAFRLINAQGNDRKTTGSYYTPTSLITLLLDSALEPVVERALKDANAETALLSLRVIDPACGSGHFLVAAAQRLARHLARVRTGEPEPAPLVLQHALRDVVRSCIYGVDVNPMSVELAKVSLWLEALEPGKPLSFLDHHLRVGNSLIGLGPNQTVTEIPDEAFTAVTGDDKKQAAELRKFNKKVRSGQMTLALGLTDADAQTHSHTLAAERRALDAMPEDTPAQISAKVAAFAASEAGGAHARLTAEADLWTAAFFWPIEKDTDPASAPTHAMLTDLRTGTPSLFTTSCVKAAAEICERVGAFHWPLAFPEVTSAGGFDVILGNPPWDMLQLNEKEYFAARDPGIAALPGAKRKEAIDRLRDWNPRLSAEFEAAKRQVDAANKFYNEGERYRFTAVGKLNSYALFSEHFRALLGERGRAGLIVPTGIATDDTTKAFFGDLTTTRALAGLLDFENKEAIFPAVHRSYKFCLLTMSGQTVEQAQFVFFATGVEQVSDPRRRFSLAPDEIALFNPNTRTMPIFRTQADAELTRKIYQCVPVLDNETTGENPWGVALKQGLFNMTSDSGLFRDAAGPGLVPLYEAKLMHQYDHRWATYVGHDDVRDLTNDEKADPSVGVNPRYWVERAEVDKALTRTDKAGNVLWQWEHGWLLGWRDIARATDERTAIFSVLPRVAVGHTMPLFFSTTVPSAVTLAAFVSGINSLTVDYCVRQKVGGTHLTFGFLEQFPILPPSAYAAADLNFIVARVVELVHTAHDVDAFANDVLAEVGADQWAAWFPNNPSVDGKPQPFRWDPERRAVLRAELDAYYAKLYGLTRDELRYILDPQDVYGPDFPGETFRVLKERELRDYGEYRTRRLVLEAWDRQN